jgi:hypothetical protein
MLCLEDPTIRLPSTGSEKGYGGSTIIRLTQRKGVNNLVEDVEELESGAPFGIV